MAALAIILILAAMNLTGTVRLPGTVIDLLFITIILITLAIAFGNHTAEAGDKML